MKKILMPALLCLTVAAYASGQTQAQKTVVPYTTAADEAVTSDIPGTSLVAPVGRQSAYVRPDAKTRRNRYLKSMFGPMALAKSAASAGISTWTNSPEEWGGQWEGFGKRVASNIGKRIISNGVTWGLDEAFKLDSHFYRSEKKNVGARVGNAVISTVTARKPNGKRVFGFPRLIGSYTSSVVSAETWYPKRYTYKDGLKNATVGIGMNAVYNLITEFLRKK